MMFMIHQKCHQFTRKQARTFHMAANVYTYRPYLAYIANLASVGAIQATIHPSQHSFVQKHVTVDDWSILKMQTFFYEKYFKASTVLFSSNDMWFRCSQHITVAAILCSVALINPVFQNILLYFIKGSTQKHSNFDQILSLNTMNIERHTLFCRSWFEWNLQTSYNDDRD